LLRDIGTARAIRHNPMPIASDGSKEQKIMDERLCRCGRWITEVEPDIWAHVEDMLVCTPDESLPVRYLDEAV